MASEETERSRRARIAALSKSAKATNRRALTAPARRAAEDRFYKNTDPALPEKVRRAQADAERALFFERLSHKGVVARNRARAALADLSDAVDELIAANGNAHTV